MLKKLAACVSIALATNCGIIFPTPKSSRDFDYQLRAPTKVAESMGETDYTVVLIPDDHDLYGCHANIYLTLQSMKGDILFVARQEREGPTEHTSEKFQKYRYLDSELQRKTYKDFMDLPKEERVREANKMAFNRTYPSISVPVRDWGYTTPMYAPILFEAVYQAEVQTIGVEDKKLVTKARDTLVFSRDKNMTKEELGEVLVTNRNKAIVKNIPKLVELARKSNPCATIVPFPVGFEHVPDLEERLKKEGISYYTLEHEPCVVRRDD